MLNESLFSFWLTKLNAYQMAASGAEGLAAISRDEGVVPVVGHAPHAN